MGSVTQRERLMFEFIQRTDRKSMFSQIKRLVTKAEGIAEKELDLRRDRLRKFLTVENQMLEEEFANKVKYTMEEEIKARHNGRLKIRDDARQAAAELLKAKRIQQRMSNCPEIREALRLRDIRNTKEIQFEQIVERERKLADERDQAKYWAQMEKSQWERETLKQKYEDCLKKKLNEQNTKILDKQLKELEIKREKERLEKANDAKVINATIRDMKLEEISRKYSPLDKQKMQLREDLLKMIKKRKEREQAEAEQAKAEQLKILAQLKQIEAEENAEVLKRKRALHNATTDYIQYVRRLREFEKERDMLRNSRIDDLKRVDICTKNNLKMEMERKAKIAAQCYAELKEQMCYQLARRWHEEIERRDYKLESPFGRVEPTRAEILAQQQKNREELDKQVSELKKIRAEQEAQYEDELIRANNDEEFCKELATKYLADGMAFLPLHPNWHRIDTCVDKNKVIRLTTPKNLSPPTWSATHTLATPLDKTSAGNETGQRNSCIEPCGCKARRPF